MIRRALITIGWFVLVGGIREPFVLTITCPTKTTIFGYPYASLPSVADATGVSQQTGVYNVTQTPEEGTHISANSTTTVNVTVIMSTGQTKICPWVVVVPPLENLGSVSFDLETGVTDMTYKTVSTSSSSAMIYRMTAKLDEKMVAPQSYPALVVAHLESGNTIYDKTYVSIRTTHDVKGQDGYVDSPIKGNVNFYKNPISLPTTKPLKVAVASKGLIESNSVRYNIYGQQK